MIFALFVATLLGTDYYNTNVLPYSLILTSNFNYKIHKQLYNDPCFQQ